MKSQLKPLIATLALAALLSGNAHAQATTGSLTGWEAFGDVVSAGGAITLTTAFLDGDADQAGNLSGTSAIDVLFGDLAGKAGVDITALDIGDQFAVEGSLVKQSFNAAAGQTLSFDWSFATLEATYLDHAFVVVDGTVFTLATTAQPGSGTQNRSFT
ncbi:MAG: PEP-CTERM sorting domain-containing protein, partial [Rhizobiales bacterium]|nr:PEP-CTERM sorting domain-containing protein [Rhizobacter sp.]